MKRSDFSRRFQIYIDNILLFFKFLWNRTPLVSKLVVQGLKLEVLFFIPGMFDPFRPWFSLPGVFWWKLIKWWWAWKRLVITWMWIEFLNRSWLKVLTRYNIYFWKHFYGLNLIGWLHLKVIPSFVKLNISYQKYQLPQ